MALRGRRVDVFVGEAASRSISRACRLCLRLATNTQGYGGGVAWMVVFSPFQLEEII